MEDRRYASRKFILASAAFLAGTGLLVAGLVSSEQWVSFTTWTLGLYCAANVSQKAVVK